MAFAAERPELSYSEFRTVGEVERSDAKFEVIREYQLAGDQPAAIEELDERLNRGERVVVLMSASFKVKSGTAACMIEQHQRAALFIATNKATVAQLTIKLLYILT